MSLPTRKVGTTAVTAIGYGAMALGGVFYGAAAPDEERFKLLDRLVEIGCTNWDTAPPYGDSEVLLGKWFARTGQRDKIFLATKFGFTPQFTVRGDPEFIKEQIELSLKKLQTDHVDLYYQHRPDPKVPIEVTVGAMAELVKAGKVKYLGLSDATPTTIRRAHAVHPISAIQIEYSPFTLFLEGPGGVIETARELGITIFAYSPTGRGLSTGRFRSIDDLSEDDARRKLPRFAPENWVHINALTDELKRIGEAHNGATPAQITLAWLMAQGADIIPLPGSKQVKYTEENISSALIKLSDEEVKTIRELCNEIEKKNLGPRNVEFHLKMGFVETPLPIDTN